ncbi:MAG: Ig-like domain-containing protein [Eubacteriales bacterium]|nr:Ig-like domain-containing protein [Eubacteriales bacterium]
MKKIKRCLSILLIVCMISTLFTGCSNKKVSNEAFQVTRADWIKMLGQEFGLGSYENDTPYYSDVDSSSEIFPYVQAAYEWGIISDSSEQFNPNDVATKGFVATTSVLASNVDYNQFDVNGDENANIIFAAGVSNIFPGLKYDKKVLSSAVTYDEAFSAAENALKAYLSDSKEDKNESTLSENVKDFRSDETTVISHEGSDYVVSSDLGSKLKAGDVFIANGEGIYASGIARKVVSVTSNADGTYSVQTTDPTLEEIYTDIDVHQTLEMVPEAIECYEGATLISDDSKTQTGYVNDKSNNAELLGNYIESDKQFTKEQSSDKQSLKFQVSYDFGKKEAVFDTSATIDGMTFDFGINQNDDGTKKISAGGSTGNTNISGNINVKDAPEKKEEKKKVENNLFGEKTKGYYDVMDKYINGKITRDQIKEETEKLKKTRIEAGAKDNLFTKLSSKYNQGKGSAKITGTISLDDIRLVSDIDWHVFGNKNIKVNMYCDREFSVKVAGSYSGEIGIASVPFVCPLGIVIDLKLVLSYNLDGSAELKFAFSDSVTFESKGLKITKAAFQSIDKGVSFNLAGTFKAGPKFELELALLGVRVIDLGVEADAVINVNMALEWVCEPTIDEAAQQFIVDNIWRLKAGYGIKLQFYLSYGYGNNLANKLGLKGKTQLGSDITLVPEKEIVIMEWAHSQDRIDIDVEQPTNTIASGTMDLSDYFVNIAAGESKVLSVSQIPEGYDKSKIVWSSSDEEIATVNESGTVTAKKEGVCIITAQTSDGKYKSECTVSVTKEYIYIGVMN